jgi:pyruvate dehydrogenase E1 component beta subunit
VAATGVETPARTVEATMAAAINMALAEALEQDETVVLLGEDIADPVGGVMTVTKGLSTRFGRRRVRDTPISEIAIAGAAVGAAVCGLRPVAEIMIMDFLAIGFDQFLNHGAQLHYLTAGRLSVPLTIRTTVTARFGAGATHSQSLEAWLMHSPGVKVAMPSNASDAQGMLTACIFDDDPCVFVENAASYFAKGPVRVEPYRIEVGRAEVKRPGNDVSLIAYGSAVDDCLTAAAELESDGVSAEVVDLRWLCPLDTETVLASVAKTHRAVVVHTARRFCGPGAEIAATISEELLSDLAAPVQRVGAPSHPIPAAPTLEQAYFPDADRVVSAARSAVAWTR